MMWGNLRLLIMQPDRRSPNTCVKKSAREKSNLQSAETNEHSDTSVPNTLDFFRLVLK